jgi:hypothetical protein
VKKEFMELGKALEIVQQTAKAAIAVPAVKLPAGKGEISIALDTVEDFIVNHFGDDGPAVCAECGRPYFVTPEGTAHHVGDGPDGINHDADAKHVPYGDAAIEARLSALFEAMERHGNAEGTETQLGDAEEFLRLAFRNMSPAQQDEFLDSQEVEEFVRRNAEDPE